MQLMSDAPSPVNGAGQIPAVPHSVEVEQALLGALLYDSRICDVIEGIVEPDDFYDDLHREIYGVIRVVHSESKRADHIEVGRYFDDFDPIVPGLTVPQYIMRVFLGCPSIRNASDYARTIRELAQRRALMTFCRSVEVDARDTNGLGELNNIIARAEAGIASVAMSKPSARQYTIGDAADQFVSIANLHYQLGAADLPGVPTGLVDLHNMIGPLQKTDLIVLAGRPAMGKTALALTITSNAAHRGMAGIDGEHTPCPVLFMSMEMSQDQLAGRLIAAKANVRADAHRKGMLEERDIRSIVNSASLIKKLPITIDVNAGLTIPSLMSIARQHKRKHGTGLIVVDYLQLMRAEYSRGNTVADITEITVGLKALAKDLDVPVLALSQLSRATESRADRRPQLSDLRGSGSIEQDADIVLFVHRDEYYLSREEPSSEEVNEHSSWKRQIDAARGKADVIIGKNRHGETGVVKLQFDAEFTRFANLSTREA